MPTKQFRPTMIEVEDTEPFYSKTWVLLGTLWGMPLGRQMMTEIRKRVIVVPLAFAGQSNMCTSGGDGIFYRLSAAFRGANGISARQELGLALMGAAGAGWTLDKIGHALAPGMSPVTVRTVNNLTHATTMANRQRVGDAVARLIEEVADGPRHPGDLTQSAPGQHSLADDLVRFLRPWLRPGAGGGSKINFDPDKELGCMGDQLRKRPPAIGLAHELCHAWRNATGQRLFDDASSCGLDDDEVMTTGFPPYQYERFSENLFRAQWPGTTQPIRVNYR